MYEFLVLLFLGMFSDQTDTVPSHSVIKDGIKQLTAPPGKRKVEDDKITQDESPTKKSSTGVV